MGTKRDHSHGSPWLAKVSLKCLLRPQHAVPSTRQQKIKVPGSLSLLNSKQVAFGLWTSSADVNLQEQSGGSRDAPEMYVAGVARRYGAPALRPPAEERATPGVARPTLSPAGGRRGAKIAFFSKGPAPQGGCLCSAHRLSPSLREKENPAPGACILQAPQSRSNLNDSLKVEGGGDSRKGAGAGTQRDVLSAPTPPAKLTSAHSATGSRTRSKSLHEPPGPAGHWLVSGGGALRGWPEGGVGPPKSHQLSTSLSKCRGGGMRAGAPAARHRGRCSSSQAPKGTKIRVSQSPDAMTPRLRH